MLAGCVNGPPPIAATAQKVAPVAPIARPAVERASLDRFARNHLNAIQAASIADRAEYCGYIYADGSGGLSATAPKRGTFASCDLFAPRRNAVASYHTHGAFGFEYDNEVPSDIDLQGDFDFNLIGYISTPGGRFWRVDPVTRRADLICGAGCLVSDSRFIPRDEASIRTSYNVPELRARSAGFR